ncbi:MAG: hypothetical protein ACUVQ2_04585 [Dissulfurimicrobium sp.]|uniref:hypothetical protein n=1 Tax=Dissulfurimicrobium sp. TaxID=2022436 RepID=UPI00404AC32C
MLELAPKDLDYEAKLDYPHLTTRFIAASFVVIGPAYFLGAFVTLRGGIIGTVATRNWKRMLIASLFVVTMLGIFVAENTSNIIFRWQNGKNVEAVRRSAPASEIFGLHITQLLLPQFEHRFKPFAIAAEKYKEHTPLINKNITSYLGIISSVGFLLLMGSVMTGMRYGAITISSATRFIVIMVLLGTIGGFGVLFAWIITPYIRAWNRISVFIAFFLWPGYCLSYSI